jgi:hypothetical protein
MPYFKTPEINIFYIHIPKTGGMSIEKYFYEKYKIERGYKNAYGYTYPNINNYNLLFGKGNTLQHTPYIIISQPQIGEKLFEICSMYNNNPLIYLSTVRNPYDRIISDLFFFVQYTNITVNSTKYDIETAIYKYLSNTEYDYDNHRLPQWTLITDCNGNIPNNMIIIKTETMTEQMHEMGFTDFSFNENTNRCGIKLNYMDLLTPTAIKQINEYYKKDFEMFGYETRLVEGLNSRRPTTTSPPLRGVS